jgi:GAF domain-containing protein
MGVPAQQWLQESLPAAKAQAVARMDDGAKLSDVLEELLMAVEQESAGGMLASVLLLDAEGKHLQHGAAPSLPRAYNTAVNGLPIGMGMGSCGTAAYLGQPVYVTDIATDPLWADFKDLALLHGLRACWSTPFRGRDGAVLGTFAVYHETPRSPTPDEVASITLIAETAAAAVQEERERARKT